MENYNHSLKKVLRQLHPDLRGSTPALNVVNTILNALCRQLTEIAISLMKPINYKNPGKKIKGKKTLSTEALIASVTLLMPSELGKHALSVGKRTVNKYKKFIDSRKSKTTSQPPVGSSDKAGLVISVSKTRNAMREILRKGQSLEDTAPVYMTAVLEYIAAELFELSGNNCLDAKRKTIQMVDLKKMFYNDLDLERLICRMKLTMPGEAPARNKFTPPVL